MPINVPDGLPAKEILDNERIFALEENVALRQNIRPLDVALLNLMPKKIETETQILRLLSKSPIQVNVDFMTVSSHESRNTPQDHLVKFYDTFDHLKDNRYDALIVTGAPVEQLDFDDVDYWNELCDIFDWSRTNVYSTLFICWGALAALYHYYGIRKINMPSKLFGLFPTKLMDEYNFLTNGFDEKFIVPHSRHAGINMADILPHIGTDLQVLGDSPVTGPSIVASPDMRQIYITGHLEYGKFTLSDEYHRDLNAGKYIEIPRNYFPDDDVSAEPYFTWRSAANLLYRNWLNYVYQMTPYDLAELTPDYHGYRCEERVWLPGMREQMGL
ncbi:MAG: homoserine O-succinyltransferase [Coriobacteriales bacterium]|nr:homoserine O-succinyltransferase [Coriobacteriales bacterium]